LQENLLLDSFGLERVVAQPIHRIKEAFEQKQLLQEVVQASTNAIPVGNVVPISSEEIYQPVLFRAAAAIGLLFVVSTAFMSLFNSNVSTAQLSFLPMPQPMESYEGILAEEINLDVPNIDTLQFNLFVPAEVLKSLKQQKLLFLWRKQKQLNRFHLEATIKLLSVHLQMLKE
jgi:hypothetical protein